MFNKYAQAILSHVVYVVVHSTFSLKMLHHPATKAAPVIPEAAVNHMIICFCKGLLSSLVEKLCCCYLDATSFVVFLTLILSSVKEQQVAVNIVSVSLTCQQVLKLYCKCSF